MSEYKVGDVYAPKSIFLAVAQMCKPTDPVRCIYEALHMSLMDFNAPRKIKMVLPNSVYLEGIPFPVTFDTLKTMFNPVYSATREKVEAPRNDIVIPELFNKILEEATEGGEAAPRESTSVVLDDFFKVAHRVKKRHKSDVVHHMAAEVGEVSECIIQPQRGGNIVEESVDVILCALDVIYLELNATHGTHEIAQVVNKLVAKKLQKWYDTCS